MKAKKILFPTDFSEAANAALATATTLAREAGAALVILHVEEPPMAYGGGELYYGVAEPQRDDLFRMLHDIVPTDPAVPHAHRMVTGDPARAIVQVAEEEEVDLIVMGTHGRSGINRLLMGSVAEAVVRRAQCPVLSLKEPSLTKSTAT